jgi:hypothetical protein
VEHPALGVAVALVEADDLAAAKSCVSSEEHEQFDSGIDLPGRLKKPLVLRLLVERDRRDGILFGIVVELD